MHSEECPLQIKENKYDGCQSFKNLFGSLEIRKLKPVEPTLFNKIDQPFCPKKLKDLSGGHLKF